MPFKQIITALILPFLFYACCKSTYECPPGDVSAIPWESFDLSDTIVFHAKGSLDEKFFIDSKEKSNSFVGMCDGSGMYCMCDPCNSSVIINGFNVNSDSDFEYYMIRSVGEGSKFNGGGQIVWVMYELGDSHGAFYADHYSNSGRTVFYKNYTYNDITYDSLGIVEEDTLLSYNTTIKVWKTYYHRTKGLVGFESRFPNRKYYLKE